MRHPDDTPNGWFFAQELVGSPVFIRIEQGQVHSRRKKDVSFELSRLAACTRYVKLELGTAQGRVRTSWSIGGAACAV